jgi:hypothetical protein
MKLAPHLNVLRVHGKLKLKLKDLADVDVIVSTSTKEWSKAFAYCTLCAPPSGCRRELLAWHCIGSA